ncbi:MAG: XdhC family protein [Acidimicrobiia bacterium]|nr:XdhC family protein [Acidimicrobiia bacterium]
MSERRRHTARVAELIGQGTPFVQATVVRAQCPTSARPGDSAVVLADGSIDGFVGGQCAEGSVRAAAVPLLASGEALLLRILPEGGDDFPESDGARTVVNPCLSGGAIEVFLEPKLPAPLLAIVGATPIAESLEILAEHLGFGVDRSAGEVPHLRGCTALLVSSHGRNEPESIRAALDAGVGFIGLVASSTRGKAVLDELALSPEERAVIHTPVGLDIGARTAEEIALSILADLVRAVRRDGLRAAESATPDLPASAIDPVCGMTVVVAPDTPHLTHDGVDHWFCNPGCRTRYAEELGLAR